MYTASLFTTIDPDRLSKSFHLDAAGKLQKLPGGNMAVGTVERIQFDTAGLVDVLTGLKPANALGWGVCAHDTARVASPLAIERGLKHSELPTIGRTREHFTYPAGPAIFMVDYDPPKEGPAMAPEEVLDLLTTVWPALADAPVVLAHSASSWIHNGDECLIGRRGCRVYVGVSNGQEIPKAGALLFDRLVLAGHGYAFISKAGQILFRTPIDGSVWQPERLDFAGGAACRAPLVQRRPAPVLINADAAPIDLSTIKPMTAKELAALGKIKAGIRADAKDEAEIVKDKWARDRAIEVLKKLDLPAPEQAAKGEELVKEFKRAVDARVLFADFELTATNGKRVTVGEILADKHRWNGARFHDPLEPDYGGNDARIAQANLLGLHPFIYSFAHGGHRYKLSAMLKTIQVEQGNRQAIVEAALDVLKTSGDLFSRDNMIVQVTDAAKINVLDTNGVQFALDCSIRFEKYNAKEDKMKATDAPKAIADGLRARQARGNGLAPLDAVLTAPAWDQKGKRILEQDGYDATAKTLLLLRPGWRPVPGEITLDDVRAAVDIMWKPFAEFPFVGPLDRGVMMAAILTACTRMTLPTAPGFLYSAPTVASGKSLLAFALSSLAGKVKPTAMAGVDAEEEFRKRLLAIACEGEPVTILDNLTGTFASDCLCAFLTSEVYSDRVLGVSQNKALPTRTLMLLTGNNVTLKGDLCRRILPCRIDPATDKPWKRSFALNPVEHCIAHRYEIVRAALTVIAYYADKARLFPDRTASFEDWSDCIRHCVVCLDADGVFASQDPVNAIEESFEEDPETGKLTQLLESLNEVFREERFTVAEIIKLAEQKTTDGKEYRYELLNAVVDEIAGTHGRINSRIFGRWIEKNKGRRVDGLYLEDAGLSHKVRQWRVRSYEGGLGGLGGFDIPTREKCPDQDFDKNIRGHGTNPPNPQNPPSGNVTPFPGRMVL